MELIGPWAIVASVTFGAARQFRMKPVAQIATEREGGGMGGWGLGMGMGVRGWDEDGGWGYFVGVLLFYSGRTSRLLKV